LIKMSMDSVSEENVEKIMNEKEVKEKELIILKTKEIKDIWMEELETLHNEYSSIQTQKKTDIIKVVKKSKTVKGDANQIKPKGKKLTLVLDE
jgi:hypothetical protein